MKRYQLKVEKRTVLGKQVKALRRAGILPCNTYGKDLESTAVQVPEKDFLVVYNEAGETGLVDIELGDKKTPVLIHNMQKNFRGKILHADFFQVNLKEKVKTMVPLEVVGEPAAILEKIGILMNIISEIEVEALPAELPEKIEVNVEHLVNIDDQVTVADLKIPEGVTVLTEGEQVVAKIAELVSKEAQEQAAEEAAAAEEASAEASAETGTEGTVPTEDETPAEGGEKTEDKPQEATKE